MAFDRGTNEQHGVKVYAASQWKRKRVEEVFGWMKTVGPQRQNPVSRGRPHMLGSRWRQRHTTT